MEEIINTELRTKKRKQSYQAKKNEGNNLFFLILNNILSSKSEIAYREHLENPTFDDVYTQVGVEKALSKCYDKSIVLSMSKIQRNYCNIREKRQHYWYLMKTLPKTMQSIDWRIDG